MIFQNRLAVKFMAENFPKPTPNVPLASTETGLASTGNSNRHPSEDSETSKLASTEYSNLPVVNPTPPPDVVEDLCTKCAREVEASRIIDAAQKQYIDSLEKRGKQADDLMMGQSVLLKQYSEALDKATKINEKSDAIIAKNNETIEKKDLEIANLKKEIEIAKSKKCGFICQATRVLIGVGIGVVLSL